MSYKTRAGKDAILIGDGPLTKTFKLIEVDGHSYLVWAKDLRYRTDNKPDNTPVLDDRDILETYNEE